ncbi:hypothetical protein OPV22_006025 [Ensete ventricosum]|uniref:RRM domain-containing protein n=1 Tax=Ensete ventricosum TaxID=4639 RepID=A0AAV8RNU7_ENSVE|nr:hypothetical protein OPV22_006025 [Ensete ventricosum]
MEETTVRAGMEEEHEMYGGEIPGEVDSVVDIESSNTVGEMKKRLKEMEEEAAALREIQAKVEKEMSAIRDAAGTSASEASKEEVDSRSVYVGNVDYGCMSEEVRMHFQSCGTVNRVTILTDRIGQPKGFAYVEFLEVEAVPEALKLNGSFLHGRRIRVCPKRTNVPGKKQVRPPRRFNPFLRPSVGRAFMAPQRFSAPYGYGRKAPGFKSSSMRPYCSRKAPGFKSSSMRYHPF